MQASRLEGLRVKLDKEGYSDISYVIVNHQGIESQLKYLHLKNQVSDQISVYQQEQNQPDVWTLLNGNKDDLFIYDRCGRLVKHLSFFLTSSHVEKAIKTAYCEEKCGNCSLKTLEDEDFCKNVSLAAVEKTPEVPQPAHNRSKHQKQGNQHLGGSELSENNQPGAAGNPVPSISLGHNYYNGQPEQDDLESLHIPEGENVQSLLRKLCQKGCRNHLQCKSSKDSQLAPHSCCCHCRHLIFERKESSVTCQCAESLPSLCSCQGLLGEEKVIESCQCRAPPIA